MSRIGKKIIPVPAKTTVTYVDGLFTVTGPLGTLSKQLKPEITITIADGNITLLPQKTTGDMIALWGTYGSHIMNMLAGVITPFSKKMILEGIGYKSEVKGSSLVMALGFSHPVNIAIPAGITVTAEKNVITVTGIDKEMVGAFAAHVRSHKLPEPYKGKGIRYEKEVVKRKQGKKSA